MQMQGTSRVTLSDTWWVSFIAFAISFLSLGVAARLALQQIAIALVIENQPAALITWLFVFAPYLILQFVR
jgi:hypothetical protein